VSPEAALDPSAQLVLQTVGNAGALAITWLLICIFMDDRRFAWVWLASGALISLSLLFTRSMPEIVPLQRLYSAAHFLGLLTLIVLSARGDLQDARRRIRPAIAVLIAVYCLGISLFSRPVLGAPNVEAALIQSTAAFVVVGLFVIWALKLNLDQWPGPTEARAPDRPSRAQVTRAQSALITRIEAAMEAGIWQREGLTVAALAQEVGAPDHQVRKAINQTLGHRNFASFINRARIEAAKAQLSAPEGATRTVLEIAYDVGFSSLGPFNRAFREATGQSPTEFREAQA
ncbi:MAG: helix-turn-helix domain-containing protein, partial [Shimia sp.]